GTIFGLYLLVTCRYCNMKHNDAFSTMRLDGYRHFLRFRIKGDEVTIFPVGLDAIPKRHEWRRNLDWKEGDPTQPAYIPDRPLQTRLIEDQIGIQALKSHAGSLGHQAVNT